LLRAVRGINVLQSGKTRRDFQRISVSRNTIETRIAFDEIVFHVSVIKVFETASRANGGRLWLVWLMTLRGSPLVLQAA
jgi:hypothetical protein